MRKLKILDREILASYNVGKSEMVAVVGNSGIKPEDQEIIDSCQCVIRFNNYATREGIEKTADPNQCDILFSTFDLHSNGSNPKDIVIGIPYPFKARQINLKPDRWYPRSNCWMVNPYLNMEMCAELQINSLGHSHPIPSIGFTALWHMREWPTQFYICGFNWYYQGMGKFQNWDLKNSDYPINWNHNYPKEIKWILQNLFRKDNFIFSKECTKVLQIAQQVSGWRI